MPIGILNPADVTHSVTVRPAYVLGGVNQRRYYSDDLGTLITQQDFNQLKEQILYAADYYAIPDLEGDDTLLRQIIAAGAGSLTGNLLLFQGLVGSPDKVPYFIGASSMDLMTVTAFSRSLLSKTAASQWRDALGISAALSGNVVALGNLASAADLLPYFNGVESMLTCAFRTWGRGFVGQIDAISARTYMGLGSASTYDESHFLTTATLSGYAPLASPAFTGDPTAPTQLQADNTTKLSTTSYVRSAIAALSATLALIATSGSATNLIAGTVPAARLPTSLSTIHALVPATDRISYYASSSTAALTPLTAFGRSLIDDIDAPTARGTLGLGTAAVRPETYFALIDSPAFTGSPTAPTPSGADSSTRIATTAFVAGAVSGATTPLAAIATSGSATDLITGTVPAARLPNTISALHGLVASSNQLAYYTSATTATFTPFTAFARTLLDDADATTMRVTLGFGSSVPSSFFQSLIDEVSAATMRTTLGLATIAVSASATDLTTGTLASTRLPASLSTIYGLTPAADRLPYYSGASTALLATFTAFGRSLMDDVDAAAGRATLGTADITGDTFTGSIVVQGNITTNEGSLYVSRIGDAAPPTIFIQGDAGTSRQIAVYTGNILRWNLILANGLGEVGAGSGSNFQLSRYDDLGAFIDNPFSIIRSTGIATFTQSPVAPTPAAADNTTKLATTAFVATNFAALAGATFKGSVFVDRVGDAVSASFSIRGDAGQTRQIVGYTGTGSARWNIILASATAESGANAGSNFILNRFDDAGALIDAAISITRSTGIMALSQIPTHPTPTVGDNTTKSATTAFIQAALGSYTTTASLAANYAPLASPALTGTPTAPTPTSSDSTTKLATTAFVASNFAALAGATFTGGISSQGSISATGGSLVVNRVGDGAAAASIFIQGIAGSSRQIAGFTGSSFRWSLFLGTAVAEGVSNAGSNFALSRYDDAGAFLDNPLAIVRSTGIATFSQSPVIPTPAGGDSSTKAASTAFVAAGFQPLDTDLTAIAGLVSAADRLPYYTGAGAAALATFTVFARTLLDDADATTARATLGLATVASSGSASDLSSGTLPSARLPASLSSIYSLTPAADRLPYYSGAGTAALATFSVFGRSLVDDADATAARTTLGLGTMSTELATDYALLSGPTFIGTVISTNTTGFALDKAVGVIRDIRFRTSGLDRWALRTNGATESGADAGSQFQIVAFSDAGVSLGSAFTINRSTQILDFTNSPTGPTPTAGDSTTKLATTAFIAASFAPLASPALTGTPTAPTQVAGDSSTRLATTAFIASSFAPLASPALTGTPTAPTQATGNSSTRLATTAFVATNFAALAGATFTGAVIVQGAITANAGSFLVNRVGDAAAASVTLQGDAGFAKQITILSGSAFRWNLTFGSAPESGSNAGSNIALSRYDDAGTLIDNPLSIIRSTGIAQFTQSPTAPTPIAGDNSTKLATTAFVTANFAAVAGATFTGAVSVDSNFSVTEGFIHINRVGDAATSQLYISGDAGQVKSIFFRSGNLNRWQLWSDGGAESGANVGSDFNLYSYDDAGASLGRVFSVPRATRVVDFTQSPTVPTPTSDDNTTKVASTAYVQNELTAYVAINAQTGTTVTVSSAMFGNLTTLNNAAGQTCALPSNATLTAPIGTWIDFMQIGAGQCTFSAGSGATVTSRASFLRTLQWGIIRATKRAANTWVLSGDGLAA